MSDEQTIPTRWTDFDTAGHMTDAAYPVFFGNARGAYLTERVGSFDQFPAVLARIEIDYRNEIPYPSESVVVRTSVAENRDKQAVLSSRSSCEATASSPPSRARCSSRGISKRAVHARSTTTRARA